MFAVHEYVCGVSGIVLYSLPAYEICLRGNHVSVLFGILCGVLQDSGDYQEGFVIRGIQGVLSRMPCERLTIKVCGTFKASQGFA